MAHNDHAKLLRAYLDDVCGRIDARTAARPWREWHRTLVGVPLAVGLSLATSACGGDSTGPTEECSGDDCMQLCDDDADNDRDGAVDCEDSDCSDVCVPGVLYGAPPGQEDCAHG